MDKQTGQVLLPLWRSILFVPAHIERYVKAAQTRGADAIQLDLEDSVPLAAKDEARKLLGPDIEHLATHDVNIVVRVNHEMNLCMQDLEAAVRSEVAAICLPKVMDLEHIHLVDKAIVELEVSKGLPIGGIQIIAMIETIEALLSVESLARACPRLTGLAIGSEDLCLDGGFDSTLENMFNPCQRVIFAARAANIRVYGLPGSIADYGNMDAFTLLVSKAKSMGFDGAFCIHPKQVEVINKTFSVGTEEIKQAQKIVDAYESGVARQKGAVEVDGKMIDLPMVERARKLLAIGNN